MSSVESSEVISVDDDMKSLMKYESFSNLRRDYFIMTITIKIFSFTFEILHISFLIKFYVV